MPSHITEYIFQVCKVLCCLNSISLVGLELYHAYRAHDSSCSVIFDHVTLLDHLMIIAQPDGAEDMSASSSTLNGELIREQQELTHNASLTVGQAETVLDVMEQESKLRCVGFTIFTFYSC